MPPTLPLQPGRMEAIVEVLKPAVEWVQPVPATEEQIGAVHTRSHIESVKAQGVYEVAALAAGGAIMAAEIGLEEPCFGLIRPPGHHASSDSAWGFCYFNNMAIAHFPSEREKKDPIRLCSRLRPPLRGRYRQHLQREPGGDCLQRLGRGEDCVSERGRIPHGRDAKPTSSGSPQASTTMSRTGAGR